MSSIRSPLCCTRSAFWRPEQVAFLAAAGRQHGWAVLFAGLGLIYSQVFPAFAFSGQLSLFVVVASVATFAASLTALRPSIAARTVAPRR